MDNPVLFIDGQCNLCNGLIRILIKIDRKKIFRYSHLQSVYASRVDKIKPFLSAPFNSVILYEMEEVYQKSEAIFKILNKLNYPWKAFSVFGFLPDKVTVFFYDVIARNRYKIFGSRTQCPVPDQNVRDLFLL